MTKFFINTKDTTYKANTNDEVYDVLNSIEVESVVSIESYSKRSGYTDVTLKFLVK